MRRRPMTLAGALMMALAMPRYGAGHAQAQRIQSEDDRERHLAAAQAKRERRLAQRRAEIQRAQGRGL